jgi:hypothetical protein
MLGEPDMRRLLPAVADILAVEIETCKPDGERTTDPL